MGPVLAQFDQRLTPHDRRPVALALSGGGDSMALLLIAALWAHANGRRLLALTVDHGLSPDSPRWSALARAAATRVGAEWRGLDWCGPRPVSGLPAAARNARHVLLAQAAREAGARVILMAHTADDVAENAWMSRHGCTLGRLRSWSPSPVWPEGRSLMLFRPLLGVRRDALRTFLRDEGQAWIDDPANEDTGQLRARARRALQGSALEMVAPAPAAPPTEVEADPLSGTVRLPMASPWLAHTVTCVSGRAAPPRRDAIERARERLTRAGDKATLGGVSLLRETESLLLARELGRTPPAGLDLTPGHAHVWDGRFEVTALQAGWRIAPLAGSAAALAHADRERVCALPAPARGALPVLFREGEASPVLAGPDVRMRSLVAERLRLATGGASREADLSCAEMAD